MDVEARVATEKGEPLTDAEAAELQVRLAAVRRWLEAYAPERAVIEIRRDALPVEAEQLRPEQRGFLRALAETATHGDAPATGEQWQAATFAVAAEHGLDAKAAFNALYLTFLGRPTARVPAGSSRASTASSSSAASARRAPSGRPSHERRRPATPRRARSDPPGGDRQARGPGPRRPGDRGRRDAAAGSSRSRTRRRPSATPSASRSARPSAAAPRPTAPRSRRFATPRPRPAPGSTRSTPSSRPPRRSSRTCCCASRTPPTPRSRSAARRPTSPSGRGATSRPATRRRPDGGTWARKPHWELGEALDIIDNPRGAKVAGSGFPVYKGLGSRLQRSLISYFLDVHTTENGFTEVWPPAVVNTASARGTGQIPDKEDQMYVVTRDDLYLIPTSEVPVTNLHRDEILDASELPIRYAAYSPCFRREAGRRRQGHPRASCASTSSTRWRWSCSRSPRTAPRRSNG